MIQKIVPKLFVYSLLFLLLREWLLPVVALTNTGYVTYIVGFVGVALLLRLINAHWLITTVVQLSYIIIFIFYVYTDNMQLLSSDAWHFFLTEWRRNLQAIFALELGQVTDVFRSVLL